MKKTFNESDIISDTVKAAVRSALMEAGITSDMVSLNRAYRLLGRGYITKGIAEGHIRVTSKIDRNSKQLIPVTEILAYREKLLNEGIIKLKP